MLVERWNDFLLSGNNILEVLSKQLPYYILVIVLSLILSYVVSRNRTEVEYRFQSLLLQFLAVSAFAILIAYVQRRVGDVYTELFSQGLLLLGVVVQSIGFLSSKLETPIAGDKAFGGLILFMIMFFVGAEAFRLEPASTESGFAPTLQTYGVSNGN